MIPAIRPQEGTGLSNVPELLEYDHKSEKDRGTPRKITLQPQQNLGSLVVLRRGAEGVKDNGTPCRQRSSARRRLRPELWRREKPCVFDLSAADYPATTVLRACRVRRGAGLTVMVTVAAADVACPSETVNWNESTPLKLASGV